MKKPDPRQMGRKRWHVGDVVHCVAPTLATSDATLTDPASIISLRTCPLRAQTSLCHAVSQANLAMARWVLLTGYV
jgi:hypothetical protein